MKRIALFLLPLVAAVASAQGAYDVAALNAFHAERAKVLLAADGWFTVAGLHLLNQGENKFGTDPLMWLGADSIVKPQPDVGTLRVLSTPRDADVFVDGQLLGRTPFERSVCSGQHRVRLRHRIGSYNATAAVIRGRTRSAFATGSAGTRAGAARTARARG